LDSLDKTINRNYFLLSSDAHIGRYVSLPTEIPEIFRAETPSVAPLGIVPNRNTG